MNVMRTAIGLAALLAQAACRGASGDAGKLVAKWSSADTTIGTGRIAERATATWCQAAGQLTLMAAGIDTGVAIRYRATAVRGGEYRVVDTTMDTSPAAVIAVRFVRGLKVMALSSDSGSLVLDPGDGSMVSGTFNAWFRESGTTVPVEVSGQFTGVRVLPDSVFCP